MPIRDILHNNVKEKLKRDEVVASMTVRLVRQAEIAQIAATAGFDTLYIDVEHASEIRRLIRHDPDAPPIESLSRQSAPNL